jgi:hypothetical protein
MGKVDHLQNTKDNGEPQGSESIDGTHQDTIDYIFQNIKHQNLRPDPDTLFPDGALPFSRQGSQLKGKS